MDSFTREDSTIFEQIEINMWTEGQAEICYFTGIPLGLYQRFFNYLYGISITAYIRKRKLTVAGANLLSKEWSVTTAALQTGYEDTSSFSRAFKEQFTVSPSAITVDKFETFKFDAFSSNDETKKRKASLQFVEYLDIAEHYLV